MNEVTVVKTPVTSKEPFVPADIVCSFLFSGSAIQTESQGAVEDCNKQSDQRAKNHKIEGYHD